MKYAHYQNFLTGYWRCIGPDYTFDYFVREDGFHIGAIPEIPEDKRSFSPMPLWLSIQVTGELQVTTVKSNNSWVRNYYRDGNRLSMNRLGEETSTRSISFRISEHDISPEAKVLFETFLAKYPLR